MVRGVRVGAGVAAVVLLALVTGCLERVPLAAPPTSSPPGATSTLSSPEPVVVAEGLGAAPSRSPTPRPPSSPKPKRKPPTETKLPPPPPRPAPADCTPRREGTAASRAQVKAALTDAAGRTYWPTSAPQIKVPLALVKASAWQESGWQSNIIACDGGVGLMQVMPATATFINDRFGQSYDIKAYADNAVLGANYLAWLVKYFGDVYFEGDYTLRACASHTDPCLINAVIASYNFGFGAVDTHDGIKIPNPRYVENVRALMTGCECLSF